MASSAAPDRHATGGRPYRVLRIITTLEPEVGGPSTSAVNQAIAEQDPELSTVVVSTRDARDPDVPHPLLTINGIRHVTKPRVRLAGELSQRWGVSPSFLWWIARNVRSFDIVHVHYVWPLGTLVGVFFGKLLRKPVVMTPHESMTSFDIGRSRSTWRRRQKAFVLGLLLRGVDRVVTASALERRDSGLSTSDGLVIPHPVPSARARDTRGRTTDPLVVGYLGRLHPKKRVELVLEAIASTERVKLVVGGNQPVEELARLESRAAELGITPRTTFLGFVPASERDDFFDSIDVLAMPSTYECFGMVAAEALAAGVPVIVSETTGISEIVEAFGGGQVVPHEDSAAIARAVRRLVDSSTHDGPDRSREARAAAEAGFSFGQYGRAVRALYVDLLGTTRRTS